MTLDEVAEAVHTTSRKREPTWDTLWQRRSVGRIAVAVGASEATAKCAQEMCVDLQICEPVNNPPSWTQSWEDALTGELFTLYAASQLPGDGFLAIGIPRFVHGQSQGICDIFGARVERQFDGNYFVYPLQDNPETIDALVPRPIEESLYWCAVEWIKYAHTATKGYFNFRMPVMTGPLDTANYLLGSTTLLEWVYTQPDTIHRLLNTITAVEIRIIRALQEAAGGVIHTCHSACSGGGYDLCSECRSLVSRKIYEEYEAPCLRRMGEELGSYAIHACGSWERTVPSGIADVNLRIMNGQTKENDLAELCRIADGQITLSINASSCLDAQYLFPDTQSFFTYILDTVPVTQPFEIACSETDIPLWNRLCEERDLDSYCLRC